MSEKKFFGEIKKLKAEGGNKINPEKLFVPLENKENSVMRSFCTGCGLLSEINKEEAFNLAEKAKVELPNDPENYYFETGRCEYCDSEDKSVKISRFLVRA